MECIAFRAEVCRSRRERHSNSRFATDIEMLTTRMIRDAVMIQSSRFLFLYQGQDVVRPG